MGLVGVVVPSHKEMEADQPGRLPRWLPPAELLELLVDQSPKFGPYPYELVAAALDQYQERDYVSVTMLVGGCPRSKVLERKEDYVLTLDSLYAAVRGTQVHRTLEHHSRPDSMAEERFHARVLGHDLSCSPDIITPQGDLMDYKVTESVPTFGYPWRSQTLQVMYNAYIARMNGIHVRSGSLVYLGPKGPKIITVERKQPWVTGKGVKTMKNQPYVWTDEEVEKGHGYTSGLQSTDLPTWNSYHKDEPGLLERMTTMTDALLRYPNFSSKWLSTWGGNNADWRCPGSPWCKLPNCLAKRFPDGMYWDQT